MRGLFHRPRRETDSTPDSRQREHGVRARIAPADGFKPLRFALMQKLTLWTTHHNRQFVHNHLHDKIISSTFHSVLALCQLAPQWLHSSKSTSPSEMAPVYGIVGSRNYFLPIGQFRSNEQTQPRTHNARRVWDRKRAIARVE